MESAETSRYRFDNQGTIQAPGPIGRVVRFLLGVLSLFVVSTLVVNIDYLTGPTFPGPGGWWFGLAFGVYLFPDVFIIGFSVPIRRKRLYLITAILASLLAVAGWVMGNAWHPFLAWFIEVWLVYIYGHLGVSHILASILATPGCEMRAIPQLWSILTGRQGEEHYCPSFIGRVDRWEENLHSKAA